MSFVNEKLVILYGSQTGNAQDLAERIWRESKRFFFRSTVQSLDEHNVLDLLNETCCVFVCSTTGDGEEPDNMKSFWRFLLKKSLPSDILCNLRFAVFGLGDSSYEKYNFVAKRLHRRLLNLGANALLSLGLGDDQHDLGYELAADPWIENLWGTLLSLYPLPAGVQPLPSNQPIIPRWCVSTKLPNSLTKSFKQQSIYYSVKSSNEFDAVLLENKRVTADDHFQDVRLLKFAVKNVNYNPGDTFCMRPNNLQWQIDELNQVLQSNGVNIPPQTVFTITEDSSDIPVPEVLQFEVTFEQLCLEYFDLLAIPRRHTFEILAQLTDSKLEKEKCLEFASANGQDELYGYTNRPKRNIVEVLQDFPHATKNITKDILFELFSPIKIRQFSVASSCKAHPGEIHILLAVVKYKTKLVKHRFGLGSNYLADLIEGDSISAWIKKGCFNFPKDPDTPVIMVGPGTGLAPFRSYIHQRVYECTANIQNLILFYGCRYRNKDFMCGKELQEFAKENKLTFIPAFSRDGPTKVYVQDKIREHKHLVWEALQKGGVICIAGNSKNMPKSVKEAVIDVVSSCGNMSKEDATKYIENMKKTYKYQSECW